VSINLKFSIVEPTGKPSYALILLLVLLLRKTKAAIAAIAAIAKIAAAKKLNFFIILYNPSFNFCFSLNIHVCGGGLLTTKRNKFSVVVQVEEKE
jgi:hypothetical protein